MTKGLSSISMNGLRNVLVLNDQSALKVIYLAIQKASQKWTMSLHDWRAAMNRFVIEFDGRIS